MQLNSASRFIIILAICAATGTLTRAQSSSATAAVTYGTTGSIDNEGLQINTSIPGIHYGWRTRPAVFSNEPGGQPYTDDTMVFGYNSTSGGVPEPGRGANGYPTLGLSLESKYWDGRDFGSEFNFYWNDPTFKIGRRPLQFNVEYSTGNVSLQMGGTLILTNSAGNVLRFEIPETGPMFYNNSIFLTTFGSSYSELNSSGSTYIPLIRLNSANEIDLTGANVRIQNATVNGTLTVGNVQTSHMSQQPGSSDSAGVISLNNGTSRTFSFATPYQSVPRCALTPLQDMGTTRYWEQPATNGITVMTSAPFTGSFNYVCMGNPS